MDKRFLSILAGIAVVFIGIFVITQNGGDKKNSSGSTSNSSQATNHTLGENQKNVVLLEYGDFQCPICEAYYSPVKEAVTKNSKDIKFQFRNLPLTSIHQNAFAAARAAEAADMQGKYWQMHDYVYDQTNWQNWTNSTNPVPLFESYAKALGLNVAKFKQDYASDTVNNRINADLAEFDKTGKEKATPTFFVNGNYLPNTVFTDSSGIPSAEKIDKYLQSQINK